MHRSKPAYFTYPLSRRPFPWRFDWVVATYTVLCVALFTVINIATNGYALQTEYTMDPNGTLAHRHWFQKAPLSWINSFTASCQGVSIAKGSSYFTSNLGLIYTLDKITQSRDGITVPVPAISYLNTTLENCTVNNVDISFQRREYSDQINNKGDFWTWDSSFASGTATCDVIADSQVYNVRFVVTLPTIRLADNNALLQTFVQLNNHSQPSVWWGANLLDLWYTRLATVMASFQTLPGGSRMDSAQMIVVPNATHTDITSLDFFNQASLLYTNNQSIFQSAAPPWTVTLGDLNRNDDPSWPFPYALQHISVNVDAFAKSFYYSTILTDLGQTGNSNAFSQHSDDHGIQYLLSALSDVSTKVGGSQNSNFTAPNHDLLQSDAYDALKDQILLRVNPATIYAQYTCSVPKVKDTPSLLVSILIGDLVLLQAAWLVLKWFASHLLVTSDERADWCEGCRLDASPRHAIVGVPVKEDDDDDDDDVEGRPGTTSMPPPRTPSPSASDVLLHAKSLPAGGGMRENHALGIVGAEKARTY